MHEFSDPYQRQSGLTGYQFWSPAREPCRPEFLRSYCRSDPPVQARLQPTSVPLEREAFEKCRQLLLSAFRSCNEPEFQHLSPILSCILQAQQSLRLSELKAALLILFSARCRRSFLEVMSTQEFGSWIRKFKGLFMIRGEHIRFDGEEMPFFLRTCPINGVDASHRTIAMISLEQLRRYSRAKANGIKVDFDEGFTFLNYAEQFWRYHCQVASRVCISLDFDPVGTTQSSLVQADDLQEHFALLQIEDDWMLVKQE